MMLTKTETNIIFRRCDICDSSNIDWVSCDDKNHLCKEHRVGNNTFKCGNGVKE